MRQAALNRRISHVRARIPAGCPACRTAPPLVILRDGDPDPPERCPHCGRPYAGLRAIRLTVVDRGPQ